MVTQDRISLELKNSLSELDALVEELRPFAQRLGLTETCCHEINAVLEELFTNIVSYGYTDSAEHLISIRVTVSLEDRTLTILMEDDGVPFNPLDAEGLDPECPLEKREPGGLGIHLTMAFVDNMVYRRQGGRNVLTLTKSLTESGSPE